VDLAARLSAVMRVDAGSFAISQDGRWDTWGDLTRLGADLDDRLRSVPSDAFIALIGRNDVATVGTLLWGLSTSRPILLVNNMQPDAALAEELLDLRPGAVVGVAADWERPGVLDAATRAGALVVRVERAPSSSAEVLSTGTSHQGSALGPSNPDCAVSLKTSGTTGPPKRVEVARRSLSASIDAVERHHGNGAATLAPQLRRGATIQMLPLAHTSAIQSICVTIAEGRQLVLLERFDPRAWGEAVRDHDVVTTGLPPAALRMILDADIDPSWLKGLRSARSGSAPLDPALAEEFERRYGVAVLQAYGATELQALASWTLKDHRELREVKSGAVGRVHPGVEVRVVDEQTGDQLPLGSSGLLEVRTAQSSAAADPDGWIRTSDIARYDDDGFLWILGRVDGMINRGGFKVDPAAVADELRSHPAIADAAVVALPDARLGHVPVAAVEVAAGSTPPTEDELRTWLRGRVEPYKVPTVIRVLDALPRTVAMKPDAEAIRRLAADQSSVDAN